MLIPVRHLTLCTVRVRQQSCTVGSLVFITYNAYEKNSSPLLGSLWLLDECEYSSSMSTLQTCLVQSGPAAWKNTELSLNVSSTSIIEEPSTISVRKPTLLNCMQEQV